MISPGRNYTYQDYWPTPGTDERARVYYLPKGVTLKTLVGLLRDLHTIEKLSRVFIYQPFRSLGVFGTSDQIALADQLIEERAK